MSSKTVFVTVGTTKFESLIESVSSKSFLDWLVSQQYTKIIVQHGRGSKPTLETSLECEIYDFKKSLEQDMKDADLVISHGGAGTIVEATKLGCKLVVVINELLMNNHQEELAEALAERKYLYMVKRTQDLESSAVRNEMAAYVPIPFRTGDPDELPRFLDSFLGFENKED